MLLETYSSISSTVVKEVAKYGGCLDKPFDDGEDLGFFRTLYDGGQWWLVTPDNHAFLSFGLNHFHSGLWAKDWNKEER